MKKITLEGIKLKIYLLGRDNKKNNKIYNEIKNLLITNKETINKECQEYIKTILKDYNYLVRAKEKTDKISSFFTDKNKIFLRKQILKNIVYLEEIIKLIK